MLRIFTSVNVQRLRPVLNSQTWVPEVVLTKYTLNVDHILLLSTIIFVVMQNNLESLSPVGYFLMRYPSAILLVFCTASNYSDHWHFPASVAHYPGFPPACPLCANRVGQSASELYRKGFYCCSESPQFHGEFDGLFKSQEETGGTSEMDVTRRAAAGSSPSIGILPIYGHPTLPFLFVLKQCSASDQDTTAWAVRVC